MTSGTSGKTLGDTIVAFLREHPEGVSSIALAETFFKLKNAPPLIAAATIRAVLSGDARLAADADGLWHAVSATPGGGEKLRALPVTAVFCCADPQTRRILCFSAFDLAWPAFVCTHTVWLVDPQRLTADDGEILAGAEAPFDAAAVAPALAAFARNLSMRVPVFLTSHHRDQLALLCAGAGEPFPDDTLAARELLRAAGCTVPRSLDLALFETAVFGEAGTGSSCRKQGERFAAGLVELLELLERKGIETRAALDAFLTREKKSFFTGKSFSYEDILTLPAAPGVYAFKDAKGNHCYIGKAKNLKRRLQSYWRETDESPGKLEQLRSISQSLVTHECGSELECLLYEYRLIRKYAPPLNKKIDISERIGTYSPLADCIVLLPHAEAGRKGMSIWFRENQKILLRPFDTGFPDKDGFVQELNSFFYTPVLPAAASDFPEAEIAVRWIKKHADDLTIVPVQRLASAEEIYESLVIAWREFAENIPPRV